MKKVPYIQIPKDFLEDPLFGDLVQAGGATAVCIFLILLLYLSHRRNCVGSFSYFTWRMLAMVWHKSVRYVKIVILNYGLVRVDMKRKSFTSHGLQCSFHIPEAILRLFTGEDDHGMESESKLNDNTLQNESKLNANSIFVRVPYIRARINRDKNKDIEKKSRRRRLEKKSAVAAADDSFHFGFCSFKLTKKSGRVGGAGGDGMDCQTGLLTTCSAGGHLLPRERSPVGVR